jgi:hypothetical protein
MNFKVSETKTNLCQVLRDACLMLLKLTKLCTQKKCTQMGVTSVPETLLGANHLNTYKTLEICSHKIRFQQQALLLHKSNKQTNNPICVV